MRFSLFRCVPGCGRWLARRLRHAAAACLCLVAALAFVIGCEQQVAPPLIQPTELAPREVEPGDRLELRGEGFPQGRTGRVVLRGTVHRAGEPAVSRVRIDAEGVVTNPDRVEIPVDEELTDRICGRGERATHATFRGEVEIAFASSTQGAPPLVGVLRDVSLDVLPSSERTSSLRARVAEGHRVLAFLGLVTGAPAARGLPIEQVLSGSIAERSGIEVGDVLAAVDGVNVLSVGDVIPISSRAAELTIFHGDARREEVKTVAMFGYAGDRIPVEYAPALVIVGLALAVLLALLLPGPPSVVALEARIAGALRRKSVSALARALFGVGRHAALSAMGSAVVAALALTRYVIGPESDGPLLLAAAGSMLVWSRVAVAKGFVASLRTTLQVGSAALVVTIATALAAGQLGAIELAEIVRAQGGAPWQFAAAQSPANAILAGVVAAAIVSVLRTRLGPDVGTIPPPAYAALLERAGLMLSAALFVAVFLGGWQLPGIAARPGRVLLLLAAMLFVAKTWLVTALLLGASRVASRRSASDVPRFVLKRLLPALVVAAAVAVASRRIVPSIAVETAFGATLALVSALFGLRMASRVRAALARSEPRASPFL